ncbi:hypothetical protein [Phenylobacterium sp.]|uniref:hypothetical protein n=1 Tax=Phenylobacterium sp. TaxID=1871053 RepID=UPI002C2CE8A5|nr:hypothetical protein [Phenylobacterium sp.]HLZ76824.1 hypothetical protein [Phenylobacterium sp.]
MHLRDRGAASIVLALLLMSSSTEARQASANQIVRVGIGGGIRVPSDSPVRYVRTGKEEGDSHFFGQFVITGTYRYGCFVGCDGPLQPDDLVLKFYPDRSLVKRLPSWVVYKEPADEIIIEKAAPFVQSVVSSKIRGQLLSNKRQYVSGRASILVDDFTMDIECDSPSYFARFVRIVQSLDAPKPTPVRQVGCG